MIRRLTAVFPLAAALVAGGCDGLFGPKELGGDLRELEGTVEFLVREIHGPVGDEVGLPQLALYMVTEREYSCIGHRIETDVDVAGGVVTVAIAGVREPDICIDTDYPAEFREILGIGEGEWTLRFVNGDRTRDFDLTVDATSIVVAGAGDAFMSPMYELFWRYPEDSFAVGCDRSGGKGEACDEVFDSVATTAGVTPYEFADAGGIPYPVSYSSATFDWDIRYWIAADEVAWQESAGRAGQVAGEYIGIRYFLVDWRNRRAGNFP